MMIPTAPSKLEENSVVGQPPDTGVGAGMVPGYYFIGNLADAADGIPDWGWSPRDRDFRLRQFWPTEPTLAGAITSTANRYASFKWSLSGPPRTTRLMQTMLQSCDGGLGWAEMMTKFLLDLFTQDNGAFLEIVRTDNSPNAPVVTLNHLDASLCVRTGRWDYPVIYTDIDTNKQHKMPWYSVLHFAEMPSPVKAARGMQVSVLTRILRSAQIMRDINTYKREKVSGRFTRAVHLVGGVQSRVVDDAIKQAQANAAAQGLLRYMQPVILGSLDPNARVSHEQIDMASLPDDYDADKDFKWYVACMAMAFGTDYQEYAPLPGGGIGSGNQAKVSSEKSRGKGPAKFMEMMQHAMNYRGVLPKSIRFEMGEMDISMEMEKTALRKERAIWLQTLTQGQIITPEVARQILADNGDIDPRYLQYMHEEDATDEIIVVTSIPPEPEEITGTGVAAPKKIESKVPAPPNNNHLAPKSPSQSQKVNPS